MLDQLRSLCRQSPSAADGAHLYLGTSQVEGPAVVGDLLVAFTDQGISYVRPAGDEEEFASEVRERFDRPVRRVTRPPRRLGEALRSGRGGQLDYDLRGLSTFEQAVLRKALEIPRGETRPYGWVAAEIGGARPCGRWERRWAQPGSRS